MGPFYYALYSRFKGKHKDEFRPDDLKNLGKLIAQMHNVMEMIPIKHRPWLDVNLYGYERLKFIMSQPFIEEDLKVSIDHHIQKALKLCENNFLTDWECIPVHGDCHIGNILWDMDGPHFLDFDDFLIAPPAFDVWMLFSGSTEETIAQKKDFFSGYEIFREFDHGSLILTEVFRTLRIIHHAAWIGERYTEEAFKRAFPYYNERRYWEQFLLNIKEQISLLQEPYVV
ncbi:MAG: Aminoglycoside phosphotransferase [uncultured bacterium]|nr:MAG: Aminoglycoside phosphotransferase [uncultured bacterium]